jgi:hypothetical protein
VVGGTGPLRVRNSRGGVEICWKTWPRVAGGRRAREALRRAHRKSGLQAARPRRLGAAPARVQQLVHAPGQARAPQLAPAVLPGRVQRQARALRLAHTLGPVPARQEAAPRAAPRAAEATMWPGRAPHVQRPVPAAALPGQPGTASGETTLLGTREGLGGVPLQVQVRRAARAGGPGPEMERAQEHGLGRQLQAPPDPVAAALARRRGRPEVLSDLALTDRARPTASRGMPAERHAPRPVAPPATARADGLFRRADRHQGRVPGHRRAGLVRLPVRNARPHGPTARGPTAPAGVPGVAPHLGMRPAPREQKAQA